MTTIEQIYAALNPLPAKLSAKGKVKPEVVLKIEANAGISTRLKWQKPFSKSDWESEYQHITGDSFEDVLTKTEAFIAELPSADQAKLHRFMGELGRLIDAGKSSGIDVEYLNPLIASMKRLSENVITHKRS